MYKDVWIGSLLRFKKLNEKKNEGKYYGVLWFVGVVQVENWEGFLFRIFFLDNLKQSVVSL